MDLSPPRRQNPAVLTVYASAVTLPWLMSSALGCLRPQRSLLLRPSPSSRLPCCRRAHRDASSKIREPRPWAVENVPPVDPRPSWVFPLSRIANYVVIPGMSISESSAHLVVPLTALCLATLLYAVFFADFGEKEHVFMPVRASPATFAFGVVMMLRARVH